MISMGIDPGTARCGYGLIESDGDRLKALEFGSIETHARARMQDRLEKIYDAVDGLMKKYQPDVMGVEKLFFGRNATTAIPVGQARGVVLLAAAKNRIELAELTPAEIKLSVTGYGGADKQQVMFMIAKLLKIEEKIALDDTADALAVAIAVAHAPRGV